MTRSRDNALATPSCPAMNTAKDGPPAWATKLVKPTPALRPSPCAGRRPWARAISPRPSPAGTAETQRHGAIKHAMPSARHDEEQRGPQRQPGSGGGDIRAGGGRHASGPSRPARGHVHRHQDRQQSAAEPAHPAPTTTARIAALAKPATREPALGKCLPAAHPRASTINPSFPARATPFPRFQRACPSAPVLGFPPRVAAGLRVFDLGGYAKRRYQRGLEINLIARPRSRSWAPDRSAARFAHPAATQGLGRRGAASAFAEGVPQGQGARHRRVRPVGKSSTHKLKGTNDYADIAGADVLHRHRRVCPETSRA